MAYERCQKLAASTFSNSHENFDSRIKALESSGRWINALRKREGGKFFFLDESAIFPCTTALQLIIPHATTQLTSKLAFSLWAFPSITYQVIATN